MRSVHFLILAIIIQLLIACQASNNEYKLSDEQMAHLVLDLQLAEVTLLDLNGQQQDSMKMLIEKKLEEIYHIPYSEIKNEMEMLNTDPKKLKLVIDRAKQMGDSIQ